MKVYCMDNDSCVMSVDKGNNLPLLHRVFNLVFNQCGKLQGLGYDLFQSTLLYIVLEIFPT